MAAAANTRVIVMILPLPLELIGASGTVGGVSQETFSLVGIWQPSAADACRSRTSFIKATGALEGRGCQDKRFICNGFSGFCPRKASECDYLVVGYCDAAQAVKLVCALGHQLHEMTTQLALLERQGVTVRNVRARAMRLEAAALRRDMREAQVLIDRLQRRYLG